MKGKKEKKVKLEVAGLPKSVYFTREMLADIEDIRKAKRDQKLSTSKIVREGIAMVKEKDKA